MSDTMLALHGLTECLYVIIAIYLSVKLWRDIKLTYFECMLSGWWACHSVYSIIGKLI